MLVDRYPESPQSKWTFETWREAIDKNYGLSCDLHKGHPFESEIDVRNFGQIQIADILMSGQTFTPKHRTALADDFLFIKFILGGAAIFEQNGDHQRFYPGRVVVIDPARSFVEAVDDGTRLLVVTCPKSALRERGYCNQLPHWIAPDICSPNVKVVSDMVRIMASHRQTVDGGMCARLSGQLLDLMDILIDAEPQSRLAGASMAARHRVKHYIAEHIGKEGLDATTIADGVRLSINQINRLFRDEGTSLMRYLWHQRLSAAHKLLGTSRQGPLRIDEIAWRCGFSSAAHFSRLFRQRYGVSPREWRRQAASLHEHGTSSAGNVAVKHI
ncbi:AraC family transcriptional regulator [Paraburkholderia phenoliruptrix]|uniref:AraC family transcriptional regulator n=1 Tax=Paraburkholderia phenoliruptrix TaxID=252970 RepID=UPI002869DDF0|nr:AraC family transcriptional regulator [Paraburkholderia phenoliruptrix]WMY09562.1 AraC family transcriptional regulator [Paraburkholderia phenoliruptrix]